MNKKIICILLTFISLIGLKAQSEIPEEPPRPTAIFTSTFWGKSGTRSISYAPWGNFAEENSTKELVRVVNGKITSTFFKESFLLRSNYKRWKIKVTLRKSSFSARFPSPQLKEKLKNTSFYFLRRRTRINLVRIWFLLKRRRFHGVHINYFHATMRLCTSQLEAKDLP